MHSGVQVKLAGGDKAEYTLRQQGIIAGRREIDIMHHNRVIGHVSHTPAACNMCYVNGLLPMRACVGMLAVTTLTVYFPYLLAEHPEVASMQLMALSSAAQKQCQQAYVLTLI